MKKNGSEIRKNRGFTLVELVIVLAVIGLLIAIAIPMYNNVLHSAETKTDESNVKMLNEAVMLFYECEGQYPEAQDFAGLITELSSKDYLQQSKIVPNREGYVYQYDAAAHRVDCIPKE